MAHLIRIRRQPTAKLAVPGVCRAGFATVDITPPPGVPMAGHSLGGRAGGGVRGRLMVRVLYLQDARGEAVAFAVADLFAGTRYLLERAAAATGPVSGIGPDRLILCGTTTHTAPGNLFANTLFDSCAQDGAGFDQARADWIAERLAAAVNEAAVAAVPAGVGYLRLPVFRITRNRSLSAFRANRDAGRWNGPGFPGEGIPEDLDAAHRAVDPRVTVLAAYERGKGGVAGALALFSCQATTLGPAESRYSADWPGVAGRTVRTLLGEEIPLAIATRSTGDAHALGGVLPQGEELCDLVGFEVGKAIAAALGDALATADDFRIEVRSGALRPEDRTCGTDPGTELARSWSFGVPALGGPEDGRTPCHRDLLGGVAGMTGDHFLERDPPQHPKVPAEAHPAALSVFPRLPTLAAPQVLPIHAVRVGPHLFATVPGEISAMAAHRIASGLARAGHGETVDLIGSAGEYAGHFTTDDEYATQHFEGAATLWGRNSARHLGARLARLAGDEPGPESARETESVFAVGSITRFARLDDDREGLRLLTEEPVVPEEEDQITIEWTLPPGSNLQFADGWLLRLEEETSPGKWLPVLVDGVPYDDVHFLFDIRLRRSGSPDATLRWTARFVLPAPHPGRHRRVALNDHAGLPALLLAAPRG